MILNAYDIWNNFFCEFSGCYVKKRGTPPYSTKPRLKKPETSNSEFNLELCAKDLYIYNILTQMNVILT